MDIKITPVGDGAVGKTSMLTSYTNKTVPQNHVATVFDNYSCNVTVNNQQVTLNLADTAGQEDFESLRTLCYPGTNVYLCVFSVNDRSSFDNIGSKWMKELMDKNKTKDSLGVPVIICGNKVDLRGSEACVSKDEGLALQRQMAAAYGSIAPSIHYMECSALKSTGLKEVFDLAIKSHLQAAYAKKKNAKGGKCSIL
jgi:small GTP-binding protein